MKAIIQEHSRNIPGTWNRNFERERPQQIAGGERYEICINKIITHIDGDLESYAGTNNDREIIPSLEGIEPCCDRLQSLDL